MPSNFFHFQTSLPSPTHPILLRNPRPTDAPAVAAILSDRANMLYERGGPPEEPMPASTAEDVLLHMRESAAHPSVLGDDEDDGRAVRNGPPRVNLVVVYFPGGRADKCPSSLSSLKDKVKASKSMEEGEKKNGEDEEDGIVIGLSGFGNISTLEVGEGPGRKRILRTGDVGAMINPPYRGRGFAVEAIRLSVEWGFAKLREGGLQLDSITASTDVENEPMIRLLEEKFEWTGVRKEKEDVPGRYWMSYEMRSEEWARKKAGGT